MCCKPTWNRVDVVDGLGDIVGTVTITTFTSITTSGFVESVSFKVPNTTGEQTSSDQVQDTGGDDKEDLHGGGRGGVVQEETDR
ncbi:hypothetical protein WICPIJ_008992 [Wickerhamomyces pijperi]|uniref:Uncharacterized protein n=1 Tax=Wickerhamomyces pijperi TaxID=599730 RepID=A0A9P8PTF2_WICPI|nr:hypothetical protein WICPIJ_008992 [Wickerhamomyces pijperi]